MSECLVSVVIPTYNRPERLKNCIHALAKQVYPPDSFEVIVVDDGSTIPIDHEELSRCDPPLRLKIISQTNSGPGIARNHGVTMACGEAVAFLDDDCVPGPDWLQNLVSVWSVDRGLLVGGTTSNALKTNTYSETSQLIVDMVYEFYNKDPENAYFFTSNNFMCDRQQFLELGGFLFTVSEDRDLCDRWRQAGLRLRWVPEASVLHYHRQSLFSFLRLHFGYGRGAFLYHQHRRSRKAGSVQEESGFRRAVPGILRSRMGRYGLLTRIRIVAALIAWQVAGTSGFFWEAIRNTGLKKMISPARATKLREP